MDPIEVAEKFETLGTFLGFSAYSILRTVFIVPLLTLAANRQLIGAKSHRFVCAANASVSCPYGIRWLVSVLEAPLVERPERESSTRSGSGCRKSFTGELRPNFMIQHASISLQRA
jgi:hypothetical protein